MTVEPLTTRIPEGRPVQGLEYGAHYSDPAGRWSGYYVRPGGSDLPMAVARLTPASDELEGSDREIVRAIQEDLRDRVRANRRTTRRESGGMPAGGVPTLIRQANEAAGE